MNNEHVICPLPWHHIAIRPDGKVYPCCYFRHDDMPEDFNLDNADPFKHPFLESVRSLIKVGSEVSGCKQCYSDEKLSGKSMRTDFLESYKDSFNKSFQIPYDPRLTYIDLALSNVCNNRCRMCGPDLSTNWYSDAKALGIPINRGLVQHENPLKNIDVSKLEYIKLIGGEPLLEQDKFVSILERCNLSNLSVFIATNTTVRPDDKLLELLLKCKKVRISCSIDAYGTLNNFLRKGSKWEEIEKNLQWYTTMFDTVIIHSVISIYNINQIPVLLNYVKENFPKVTFKYVMVDGPDWIRPCNLPAEVKNVIMQQIYNIEHEEISSIKNIIYEALGSPGNFWHFKEYDDKLNNLRSEHWKDHNPELYELVKHLYE